MEVTMLPPSEVILAGGPTTPILRGTAVADVHAMRWSFPGADVEARNVGKRLELAVSAPGRELERIAVRWSVRVPADVRVLGDAWERSYGDLGFHTLRPERLLPWYALATTEPFGTAWSFDALARDASGTSLGIGVEVGPSAWCGWTVDDDGITLWLDVRAGGAPLRLGERTLLPATIVAVAGEAGEPSFEVARDLCQAVSPPSGTRREPIVGCNNWYYAYGVGFDADAVVRDADMIAEAAGDSAVRPYCVIDAGWSEGGTAPGGPWREGADSFADMQAVAERIRAAGARPGLWFRPLLSRVPTVATHPDPYDDGFAIDASRPEALAAVAADLQRFREWGFELVKHDFSTHDVVGRFLPTGNTPLWSAPWSFVDRSRTTVEILTQFYRTVRAAAADMTVIGCNTVGHLAAGLVDAQRTGDDTSGRQWERSRRMGVNTLGFRLPQHGAFFTVDADCVPVTRSTHWQTDRQLLDLIAASGTALFVSIDPGERTNAVDDAVAAAVRTALAGGLNGGVRPLNWELTSCPRTWRIGGQDRTFTWTDSWGADPALDSI